MEIEIKHLLIHENILLNADLLSQKHQIFLSLFMGIKKRGT